MSNFWGDALYGCWQAGGNPDRLSQDRAQEAEYSGRYADGYDYGAAQAQRWQEASREERRHEEGYYAHSLAEQAEADYAELCSAEYAAYVVDQLLARLDGLEVAE